MGVTIVSEQIPETQESRKILFVQAVPGLVAMLLILAS